MPRDDRQQKWLLNRVGYGSCSRTYWFLGMEERGEPDEIQERMTRPWIDDVRDFHVQAFNGRHASLFVGRKPKTQATWRKLIRTLLVATTGTATLEEIRRYQAEQWGRLDGESLLAELFPLAAPGLVDNPYREHLLPHRIALFRRMYADHQPRFVVAYGKDYWDHYKAIFASDGAEWKPLPDDCGGGLARGPIALVRHPVVRGTTTSHFDAIGRHLSAFVPRRR